MFSKEYFLYLLKSKKYLLILIGLITLLNVVGNQSEGFMLLLQVFFTLVLVFAVSVDVFYHVHDKKAADTYFSLPLSRRKMLITGIVFSVAVVYLPFALSIVRTGLGNKDFRLPLILAEMFLTVVVTVVFNTVLYLLGNNLVDGVVMMGAYTFMPVAIEAILNSFFYSYVAGMRGFEFYLIRFLSPIYMGIYLFDTGTFDPATVAALLVFLAVSGYLLYRSYVDRDAERAGSHSTKFFSYPFVINFYLIVCLFLIASFFNLNYDGLKAFAEDYFVLYLLLFTVFIAAYFLYRRKFYFSWKLPLFYVAVLAVSLFCATLCIEMKGFGLSYGYEKAQGKDFCTINIWADQENQVYQYVKENSDLDPEYVQVYVEIGSKDIRINMGMKEETADIIEQLRVRAIDFFYEKHDELSVNGNMFISDEKEEHFYQYQLKEVPDLETLQKLAEDPAVSVMISTMQREYRLRPDGSLQILEDYADYDKGVTDH